jgi:hypothetical protein
MKVVDKNDCKIVREMTDHAVPKGIVLHSQQGKNQSDWNKPYEADKCEVKDPK